MKLKEETTNWFREMWVVVIVGVSEAALLVIAVPRLFNDWNELGRIIAVTAIAKFFYFMKQSPLPRSRPVQVTMSGPGASLTIEQPAQVGKDATPEKSKRKQTE